jgi:hypothetical protein
MSKANNDVNWRGDGKGKEQRKQNWEQAPPDLHLPKFGYYSNYSIDNPTKANIESINSTLIAAALLNPLLLLPQIRKR